MNGLILVYLRTSVLTLCLDIWDSSVGSSGWTWQDLLELLTADVKDLITVLIKNYSFDVYLRMLTFSFPLFPYLQG